ncbi:anaerobic ribonucleoside-triphosphate reductase activating protein [Candidatus Woesearchaeota archaeon]|nr:anaerobic ribonucleoside-triphosphate reductase activating protein [Candidatus Woesearchaeota archaeon]
MIIKGFQPLTLLDFPGQLAAIVFTAGCPWRCPYCYNKPLATNSTKLPEISQEDIFSFLGTRKGKLDGVVITGGEPTIHKDLPDFIKKIKALGFLVKLDTNGTNPKMLKELVDDKLLDYIAMDIKASPSGYAIAAGAKADIEAIKETAKLMMGSGVEYEFRTTSLPAIVKESDFLEIAAWIRGAKKYCLQQFKPMGDLMDTSFYKEQAYSEKDLNDFRELLRPFFGKIEIRL